MSAEQIAGAALMGLSIASTGISVQAAGNLLASATTMKTLHRRHSARRHRVSTKGLSVSNAVFGEPRRQRKRRR